VHRSIHARLAGGCLFAATLAAGSNALAGSPYTLFEAGQVRPLALSPSGKRLFAVNTPDGRLEVFRVDSSGLRHQASIPVGVEPVAVAARSDHEVWVVNHLSDSVSVVRLDDGEGGGGVVRTLLVGDEPRDIVFAGPGKSRAFVTTAHRGQNAPFDPQLSTPGVGRADVWVFDADDLGASLGGDPLTIVNLFTDTPRALAVSPDGSHVYAAGFHSGNRTTSITQSAFTDEEIALLPGPSTNAQGVPAPATGIIVKFDGAHWVDEDGQTWDSKVRFNLPDKDVFVIDAGASPPAQVAGAGGFYTGVGTVLYNMAVNPVTGRVYVSNTEAHNDESFEGPGVFAGHSIRGRSVDNRVTVLGPGGAVTARDLNTHLNLASCCAPVPNAESLESLAIPTGMAVSGDGATLYVAVLGSSKVGILSTAAIEAGTYRTSTADQVVVSGGGPTGLALDEAHHRLYVLTRFDDSISIIDTRARAEVGHVAMSNPEPASVTTGRRFLYDASFGSAHGNIACASCHVFGDFDSLAWNLGNPDASTTPDPGPYATPLVDPLSGQPVAPVFHPMKGPMTTQSLRGMANHGPMHWRGDRTAGNDEPSAQPDSGAFDEHADFEKFQAGFIDLLGRSGPIPDDAMSAFADFILQLRYPPNPIRNLDNSLTADQQAGRDLFTGPRKIDGGIANCVFCHTLDPQGNAQYGVDAPGFFGTSGLSVPDPEPLHLFKIPHLRNMYQKVGMFGMTENTFFPFDSFANTGDEVRGFGFLHDGSADTMFRFHGNGGFTTAVTPEGFSLDAQGDEQRRQVEDFLFAFDSNLAPIVGQQVTLTGSNGAVAGPRIALLESRADVGECDLVAKTWLGGEELGFLYVGGGQFLTDHPGSPTVDEGWVRSVGTGGWRALTYTCLPPGEGMRVAFDDGDGDDSP
jgi:DNA-binding beta-propeller fold protein YncE